MKSKHDEMNKVMFDPRDEAEQIYKLNTNTMSEVIYCGSGKKQNDGWLKATINVDKFKDHISEFKGHKFIKLNININEKADQYGKDVSISIDTWEPESAMDATASDADTSDSSDSLPF